MNNSSLDNANLSFSNNGYVEFPFGNINLYYLVTSYTIISIVGWLLNLYILLLFHFFEDLSSNAQIKSIQLLAIIELQRDSFRLIINLGGADLPKLGCLILVCLAMSMTNMNIMMLIYMAYERYLAVANPLYFLGLDHKSRANRVFWLIEAHTIPVIILCLYHGLSNFQPWVESTACNGLPLGTILAFSIVVKLLAILMLAISYTYFFIHTRKKMNAVEHLVKIQINNWTVLPQQTANTAQAKDVLQTVIAAVGACILLIGIPYLLIITVRVAKLGEQWLRLSMWLASISNAVNSTLNMPIYLRRLAAFRTSFKKSFFFYRKIKIKSHAQT